MHHHRRRSRATLIGSLAAGITATLTGFALATPGSAATSAHQPLHGAAARQAAFGNFLGSTHNNKVLRANNSTASNGSDGGDADLADQLAQYNAERTAPAGYLTGDAIGGAAAQAASIPSTPGSWQQFTSQAYNGQPSNYTDPFWSNVGAGFSLVGGRVTALATTPDGAWFAGAADGGVWRSFDEGAHWTPVTDNLPDMSTGALAVDPVTGALWLGTGEANESQDSYQGDGVWTTSNDGRSWQNVGGSSDPIGPRTVFRVTFDQSGNAYAATNNGLFRWDASAKQWSEVLDPAGATDFPPYDQQVTDVAVVPGTNGQDVIAAIGWHGPANIAHNGFYESTDSGHTFAEVNPTGNLSAAHIGRTTFAYSADGSKLYATVEDATSSGSSLLGIFAASGNANRAASVTGPWKQIATSADLAADGSASATFGSVGVQAWYNQDLAVDPANPDHVYAGLEEVFESTNGGKTWVTASPYWNFGLACGTNCPNTTHPDQHAMMIAGGKIVIGNDGGVYSRPLSDTQQYGDWTDLNATLHNLQFYDARAGKLADGSTQTVGGLQDNGTMVDDNAFSQAVEPAGGDGFYVIVDPANANNWVGEYVDGTEYSTTDGGHTFNSFLSPTCAGQANVGETPRPDCDPNARFVTPMIQDQQVATTWVTGGEDVWVTTKGWGTSCTASACDWTPVFDTGAGHAVTALSSANNGAVIYAAWVAGGGNPGPSFASGIATNYGGTWHQLSTAGLPDRFISGVTVDPANPAHAYAIFNGYSRRFIPGGGNGHVFETWNGGQSWTDISGNLPDVASDALVLSNGGLALATDAGVYTARENEGANTQWLHLGSGLPNVVVDDLTAGPDGYIYAGTHGRGIWRFKFS
jgi:sugar lactone lactonase YvrE